jgi:hypothetical protein
VSLTDLILVWLTCFLAALAVLGSLVLARRRPSRGRLPFGPAGGSAAKALLTSLALVCVAAGVGYALASLG